MDVDYTRMDEGTRVSGFEIIRICPKCGRKGAYRCSQFSRSSDEYHYYTHRAHMSGPFREVDDGCYATAPDL